MKTPIKTAWAVPVAILCALLVSGGAVFALLQSGLPVFSETKVEQAPPPPPEPVRSQWKVSPAAVTLRAALQEPPKGWEARGNTLESPQAPSPFSCGTDGVNPVLSYAQNYQAKGGAIQVMLSAYSAGLAREGIEDKLESANSCGPVTFSENVITEFSDGHEINVTSAGQRTKTIMFRHGDVVVYVIGDRSNSQIRRSAQMFRDHLEARMKDVCVNPDYDGQEGKRTLFGNEGYEGYTVADKVIIPEVPKPEVPEGEDYAAVEIGKELPSLREVDLPAKPTQYPVWPELPTPVEKPTEPEIPVEKAPTEKTWGRLAEDTRGPGCGWNFTGTTAPQYNEAESQKKNTEAEAKAARELQAEAQAWQQSVLDYWKAVDQFEQDAPQWNTYVSEVKTVSTIWAEIGREWDAYWAEKNEWDREVAARNNFLARQKNAQESYDDAVQQCQVWESGQADREARYARDLAEYEKQLEAWERARRQSQPTPTPTPSPSGSGGASESPSPSATPTRSVGPRPTPPVMPSGPVCPPERPAILDQAAPTVGEEPSTPPDPRPASERD